MYINARSTFELLYIYSPIPSRKIGIFEYSHTFEFILVTHNQSIQNGELYFSLSRHSLANHAFLCQLFAFRQMFMRYFFAK